jgi:threonyl-tRNA synthetase
VIVGEKEMTDGTVSVRRQGGIDAGTMPVEEFAALVSNEIKDQLT